MTGNTLQFVCFETTLAAQEFLPRWSPVASSFMVRGLRRIVLSETMQPAKRFGFVSRNLWDPTSFAQTFPSGLPREAGGNGVVAVQAGGFRVVASADVDFERARTGFVKAICFLEVEDDASGASTLIEAAVSGLASRTNGWAVFANSETSRRGRFDAMAEVYSSFADGPAMIAELDTAISGIPSIRAHTSALYKEIQSLP